MDFPSYPARPTNGGALERALPKVGDWAWQPKVADWRGIVHSQDGRVWNRHGFPLSITEKIRPALTQLRETCAGWLDCGIMDRQPLMRGCIIVFDLLPIGEEHLTYDERRERLEKGFEVMRLEQFPQGNRASLIKAGRAIGIDDANFERRLDTLQADRNTIHLANQIERNNTRREFNKVDRTRAKKPTEELRVKLKDFVESQPWTS